MHGARLFGPNLRYAILINADLQKASLIQANLGNAMLSGADLSGAILLGANLGFAFMKDVIYDEHTHWPEGFDLEQALRGSIFLSIDMPLGV